MGVSHWAQTNAKMKKINSSIFSDDEEHVEIYVALSDTYLTFELIFVQYDLSLGV